MGEEINEEVSGVSESHALCGKGHSTVGVHLELHSLGHGGPSNVGGPEAAST